MPLMKRITAVKAAAHAKRAKQTPPPDQDIPLAISLVAFKEAVTTVVQAAISALIQQLKDSEHPDEELVAHGGMPPPASHMSQAMPPENAQLAAGMAADRSMLIEQPIQ